MNEACHPIAPTVLREVGREFLIPNSSFLNHEECDV